MTYLFNRQVPKRIAHCISFNFLYFKLTVGRYGYHIFFTFKYKYTIISIKKKTDKRSYYHYHKHIYITIQCISHYR